MPTHFQFIGTNDECEVDSRWSPLCEVDDPKLVDSSVVGCQASDSAEKFRCLGLKILGTAGKRAAAVGRIRIWHEVD